MILFVILTAIFTFGIMCELASIATKLDKIIDNQDIIKCIEKNK